MRLACSPGASVSWVRSPVNSTRSGDVPRPLTSSTARSKAVVPIGPSKPTWVSLNWKNVNGSGRSPFPRPSRRAVSAPSAPPASAGATV